MGARVRPSNWTLLIQPSFTLVAYPPNGVRFCCARHPTALSKHKQDGWIQRISAEVPTINSETSRKRVVDFQSNHEFAGAFRLCNGVS